MAVKVGVSCSMIDRSVARGVYIYVYIYIYMQERINDVDFIMIINLPHVNSILLKYNR